MKYRLLLLLGVLTFTSSLQIFKPSFTERIALRVEDTKFSVREVLGKSPKPVDEIVVVAIDEKSVNELGRWPWSRKLIARLVENLSEAKVVALDIVFSEAEGDADRELAHAIERSGNVILGFFFRLESSQETSEESLRYLQESEFLRYRLEDEKVGLLDIPYVELNIPILMSSATAVGFLNAEPDADAIYRKYTLAHLFRGGVYLPLALQALRFYEGKDIEMVLSRRGVEKLIYRGREVPVYEGRFHRINFYRPEDIKVIPAVDVIRGRVRRDFFKGKAVFVGATEIGIYDVRPTPVDPITPGVFLHATTFSNFRAFHFINNSTLADLSALFLLVISPALFFKLREFRKRFFLYLAALTFYPVLSYLLFSYLSFDLNLFYPYIALLISSVSHEALKVLMAEKSIRELRRAFSSYLSPQLLEIVTKNPERLKLGGERRKITVLFSDIRGFTFLSERLKPEELVNLLNEFFTPMTEVILKNGGMLDKYIGDAVMAVFNAPVDLGNHAERACASALEMVEALKELNPQFRERFGVELEIGVGINTGEAVVGNMGSKQRFDYTAIGDTVNLASRLEGLNKEYETRIIVSEYTKEELGENFLLRKLDRVIVKGRSEAVTIYELLEDTEENRKMAIAFEKALEEYFRGNFESALNLFQEVNLRFGDRVSSIFVKRCRELIKNPPSEWNGVYVAREK